MSDKLRWNIWASALSHELKPLAVVLVESAEDDGTNIFPGVAYLVWKLGKSERTVQYGLKKLLADDILAVEDHLQGGRGHKTEYRFNAGKLPQREPWKSPIRKGAIFNIKGASNDIKGASNDIKGATAETERVQSPTAAADLSLFSDHKDQDLITYGPDVACKTPKPKKRSKKPPTVDDIYADPQFAEWWNTYPSSPNKTAKAEAAREWAKLSPSAELYAEMIAKLRLQAKLHNWTKEGGTYVPKPVRYLRDCRWEDEIVNGTKRDRPINSVMRDDPHYYDREPDAKPDLDAEPYWDRKQAEAANGQMSDDQYGEDFAFPADYVWPDGKQRDEHGRVIAG